MTREPRFFIGQEIEDEDGWRIVVAVEEDGIWVMDKHGAERFKEETI